jgi:hypothetical protein
VDGLPPMEWLTLDCHTNRCGGVTSYPLPRIFFHGYSSQLRKPFYHVCPYFRGNRLRRLVFTSVTEVKPESSGFTSAPVHCLHLRASLGYLPEAPTSSCSTRPVIQVMGSLVFSKLCVADGYNITSWNDWIIGPLRGS